MTKIFSNSIPQSAPRSKAITLPELICFALLCVGLLVMMVPTAQRRHSLVPVAPRTTVAAKVAVAPKSNVVLGKKSLWAFNWSRPRFNVH